jgi:hypothetical protein
MVASRRLQTWLTLVEGSAELLYLQQHRCERLAALYCILAHVGHACLRAAETRRQNSAGGVVGRGGARELPGGLRRGLSTRTMRSPVAFSRETAADSRPAGILSSRHHVHT